MLICLETLRGGMEAAPCPAVPTQKRCQYGKPTQEAKTRGGLQLKASLSKKLGSPYLKSKPDLVVHTIPATREAR
jgi:hypothetical protein